MVTLYGKKKKVPASGLSAAEIKRLAIDKLRGSALDEDDYAAMKIAPVTIDMAKQRLKLPIAKECFQIPYFDLDGKVIPFFRVRYVVDTRTGFEKLAGKKAIRYMQAKDSDAGVYFPPFVNWKDIAADPTCKVVITEGELKAACATKHGIPTIGLGGVWSFQSKAHNDGLIPVLNKIVWKDRIVYICYDSDAATNPKVVMAEQRLAQRLLEAGAHVYIVRMPANDDIQKCGIDDFIVMYGFAKFVELLDDDKTYEYEPTKVLHQLSERVVYVRNPGLIWDHKMQQRMAPSDFISHHFANIHYFQTTVNKQGVESFTKVSAARAWIQWEARAECPGLEFAPGQQRITDEGNLNTWTGWGVSSPVEGCVAMWDDLLKHIFGGDWQARTWFEQWLAYPLQHPGAKLATAAAIWGPVHGSGKTLIGHTIMRIYGKHAAELKDTDLEDDRNEWADGLCFVLGDDITAKGDRKMMRRLMTMITQKHIRLNPKYVPSYTLRDTINYYYTSNEPDMFYMDGQDRRFFIFETKAGKYANYKEYVQWRDSDEGIGALWHYLLNLDLSGFDPQAPAPETNSKKVMIEMGKSEVGAWVQDFKRNTDFILEQAGMGGDLYSMKQLHALFDPTGSSKASVNALAREFKREGYSPCCDGAPIKITAKNGAPEVQCVVWPVRNQRMWQGKSWKEVRDEYERHHKPQPAGKKKF